MTAAAKNTNQNIQERIRKLGSEHHSDITEIHGSPSSDNCMETMSLRCKTIYINALKASKKNDKGNQREHISYSKGF